MLRLRQVILICIGAGVCYLRPDQGGKLVKEFLNEIWEV